MNYYMILEVTSMATEKDIKDAYRRLAKKFHPDVCDRPDAKERFEEVAEAYEILHDSQKRLQYDRYLNDLEMRKTKFYQESEQKEKYEQEFRQAQYEARKKAAEYSKSPLEEILFGIVDVAVDITYEVGKAVLVGQSKDIDLSLGQNIGIGLKGIFLTICIALTFTGVLAPITLPLGIWIYKTLFYQGKFIGLWCLIKNVIIVAFTIALAIIIIAVAMEGV